MKCRWIFIPVLVASLIACEEHVVRSSGMYSSAQYGGVPSATRGVPIVPPPQQDNFDPLGDLWALIMSPFRALSGNEGPRDVNSSVSWQGQNVTVPSNLTGEVPVKSRDGQNYNLRFENGEYKAATPVARPAPSSDAPAEK